MAAQSLQDWIDCQGPLDARCVVVQRSSLLKILGRDLENGTATVRRHDGTESVVDWDTACQDYFSIENGAYLKPRFHPLRALVVDRAMSVQHDGATVSLVVGSVILMDGNAAVAVLSQEEYLRDFEVVAAHNLTGA